jgi:hypothetical protein
VQLLTYLDIVVDILDKLCNLEKINHMNAPELNRILEREFRRLGGSDGKTSKTVGQMVDFFGAGISTSLLYKWTSGGRDISRKGARQIARAFRPDDLEGAEQLENELLKTAQPAAEDLEIADWFAQHASAENLMAVEFRELPVLTSPEGKKNYLRFIARAVADGLTYAIILPFGTSPNWLGKLPGPLLRYITALTEHVMQLYNDVLFEAFEEMSHEKENDSNLRNQLIAVHGRLKLYMLDSDNVASCPAIGYRLFYIAKREPTSADSRGAESQDGERWEWVVSRDRHHMIPKASSPEELEATTIRYFPIVEYWREEKVLAQKAGQLTDFAKKLEEREGYMTQHRLTPDYVKWSVFMEGQSAEAAVDKYLAKAFKQS